VYVHVFKNSSFTEDTHPAAYLQHAAVLPFWCRRVSLAKAKGRDRRAVEQLRSVLIRVAGKKMQLRRRYQEERPKYLAAYVRWVETMRPPFDVVVCCPSGRDEARFYLAPVLNAAIKTNHEAKDLSRAFCKERFFKAGAERGDGRERSQENRLPV
jgi:hypothetical protein